MGVKVIVTGAAGRMGGRIIRMIREMQDIEVTGAIETPGNPLVGKDLGEALGFGATGLRIVDRLEDGMEGGDVVIDFTTPDASLRHLEIAAARSCAMVIGSTGFSGEEMRRIASLAKDVPCVCAPNMSLGLNVLLKVLEWVAPVLGDGFDVEILEAHHRQKKDAPSGTAMRIADVLARSLDRDLEDVGVYARRGLIGERKPLEIGIQTLRAGDIVGEHMVLFAGTGERLEFIHRAHSRDNFARGAIAAARWIVRQKNGLYDIQDVLGLKSV